MPLGTSWLWKIVRVMRVFLFTSGETKLLMVLMLLSTQAVKKYCFLPNNRAKAAVIPCPQMLSHFTSSTKHSPSVTLSDIAFLWLNWKQIKRRGKERQRNFEDGIIFFSIQIIFGTSQIVAQNTKVFTPHFHSVTLASAHATKRQC